MFVVLVCGEFSAAVEVELMRAGIPVVLARSAYMDGPDAVITADVPARVADAERFVARLDRKLRRGRAALRVSEERALFAPDARAGRVEPAHVSPARVSARVSALNPRAVLRGPGRVLVEPRTAVVLRLLETKKYAGIRTVHMDESWEASDAVAAELARRGIRLADGSPVSKAPVQAALGPKETPGPSRDSAVLSHLDLAVADSSVAAALAEAYRSAFAGVFCAETKIDTAVIAEGDVLGYHGLKIAFPEIFVHVICTRMRVLERTAAFPRTRFVYPPSSNDASAQFMDDSFFVLEHLRVAAGKRAVAILYM